MSETFVTYHVYRNVSPEETKIPIAERERVATSAPPPLGPRGIVSRALVDAEPWLWSPNAVRDVASTSVSTNSTTRIPRHRQTARTAPGRRSALIHFGKRLYAFVSSVAPRNFMAVSVRFNAEESRQAMKSRARLLA